MSLKDVAEHGEGPGAALLAEVLECACSGVMACSTCHVYVDRDSWDTVGAPSEEEQDMIDLAHEPGPYSRLGCQILLTPEMGGARILLPSGANNLCALFFPPDPRPPSRRRARQSARQLSLAALVSPSHQLARTDWPSPSLSGSPGYGCITHFPLASTPAADACAEHLLPVPQVRPHSFRVNSYP